MPSNLPAHYYGSYNASPDEARSRIRSAETPVSGPPVIFITLFDAQMNMSVRSFYASLVGQGHACKVIRFGHTVPYEHNLDYSLFQTVQVKFPLARPPLEVSYVENLKESLARFQPLWVGLNVVSPHNHTARKLTAAIRESVDCPIVWGGMMATNEPEWAIRYADAVCVGEGERMVVEYTRMLKSGRIELDSIPDRKSVV